jgi:hypothetical protein
MKAFLAAICLSLIMIGCATSASKPAREVQVFKIEQPPTQKYTILKTLTDDGTEEEEQEITAEFVKRAIFIRPMLSDSSNCLSP